MKFRLSRVYLENDITIAGQTEMFVKGSITKSSFTNNEDIVESTICQGSDGQVVIPNLLVEVQNDGVIFSILNPNKDLVKLRKYTHITTLQAVSSALVCDVENSVKIDPDFELGDALPEHLKIMIDNISSELSDENKTKLVSYLCQYSDIFLGPDGKLGRTTKVNHTIDTGNHKPVELPPRRRPITQREIAEKEIKTMLDQDVIEQSCSPWPSPIVLVKKKDGSTRFCVDYRKLNTLTVKDAYPLPRVDELIDALSGS